MHDATSTSQHVNAVLVLLVAQWIPKLLCVTIEALNLCVIAMFAAVFVLIL
jgi:hypothetical protein